MAVQQQRLSETEQAMIEALDDTAEHVAWEFDRDNYEGVSTCGFASIINIDGRKSFVKRIKSLGETRHSMVVHKLHGNRESWNISAGGLEMSLSEDSYRGGYRLSISNVADFRPGPEMQRLDVRERLHDLVLERLREHGYLEGARRTSRVD